MSLQNTFTSPRTRPRRASFFSTWFSRWRRRTTGSGVRASSALGMTEAAVAAAAAVAGVVGAVDVVDVLIGAGRCAWRSHSIRRTSHRWRSAWLALGSAALISAVRSQAFAIGRQCIAPG